MLAEACAGAKVSILDDLGRIPYDAASDWHLLGHRCRVGSCKSRLGRCESASPWRARRIAEVRREPSWERWKKVKTFAPARGYNTRRKPRQWIPLAAANQDPSATKTLEDLKNLSRRIVP